MTNPRDPKPPDPAQQTEKREAAIDEILEGTFPASDPPTWDTVAEPREEPAIDPNLPD